MARTSKTVIGGGEGEQGERMMRASAQGHAAQSQARAELIAQRERGMDRATQQGAQAAAVIGQHEEREQQAAQFSQRMAQDQAQFDARMAQDQQQFDRGMAQRDSQLDLEGAKAGFERGGEQGGENTRRAQLEAEMRKGADQPKIGPLTPESQQRLDQQVGQTMEMDRSGKWRPTQERTENMAREQQRADYQADTERMRARAYQQQVAVSAQRALAGGDMEQYETDAKLLANKPNGEQLRFDRFNTLKATEEDWSKLEEAADGNPDPTVAADIKARQFTPRVRTFMRQKVASDAMESIINSGGSFNHLNVDWTNPKMVEFAESRQRLNMFAATNPAFAEMLKIKDTGDKMRKLSTMAALEVWMGISRAAIGAGAGNSLPATKALQGGGAPQGLEQQARGTTQAHATDPMTQRAIAARAAGDTNVPPTDTAAFRDRFGDPDPSKLRSGGRPDVTYPGAR